MPLQSEELEKENAHLRSVGPLGPHELHDVLGKKDLELGEYKRALHDAEGKNGVLLADLRGAHGMADDVRNLKELLTKRDVDIDGLKAENARMKMDMTRDIERLEVSE